MQLILTAFVRILLKLLPLGPYLHYALGGTSLGNLLQLLWTMETFHHISPWDLTLSL
uniref:Uncharacterized protein n=1 Tax=Picea glauca TaxID=3330 RepID=A0A117NHX0_PICGL|nr:hypothetical protein ABT39_MTgene4378 [Picea glauca]